VCFNVAALGTVAIAYFKLVDYIVNGSLHSGDKRIVIKKYLTLAYFIYLLTFYFDGIFRASGAKHYMALGIVLIALIILLLFLIAGAIACVLNIKDRMRRRKFDD
jgi:hypothetical protein